MLARLDELAAERANFAFETTLASRTFAPFLRELRASGYEVQIIYVWLRSPDLSVNRVAERVARGGHHVPEETVRRRYARGRENFQRTYRLLADHWIVCDNSGKAIRPLAVGSGERVVWVLDGESFDEFENAATSP
jgi:predicted ABC-type ATPase